MNIFLENEKSALEQKITQAREKGNEGTYKNLIQAYERILNLIHEEEKRDKNKEEVILYFDTDNNNEYVKIYVGRQIFIVDMSKNPEDFLESFIFTYYNICGIYGDAETENGKLLKEIFKRKGYSVNTTPIRHHLFDSKYFIVYKNNDIA